MRIFTAQKYPLTSISHHHLQYNNLLKKIFLSEKRFLYYRQHCNIQIFLKCPIHNRERYRIELDPQDRPNWPPERIPFALHLSLRFSYRNNGLWHSSHGWHRTVLAVHHKCPLGTSWFSNWRGGTSLCREFESPHRYQRHWTGSTSATCSTVPRLNRNDCESGFGDHGHCLENTMLYFVQ